MSAYNPDDFIMYAGKGIHRNVAFTKVAPLGWTREQVASFTEEDLAVVLKGRLGPGAALPSHVDLAPQVEKKPITNKELQEKLDSDFTDVGDEGIKKIIPPPTSRLNPVDPTKTPGAVPTSPAIMPQLQQVGPVTPLNLEPRGDAGKLKSILDAAAALAGVNPDLAKQLLTEHNLQKVFITVYPAVSKIFDAAYIKSLPAGLEGSVILAVEAYPTITHIITSQGTMTVLGRILTKETK